MQDSIQKSPLKVSNSRKISSKFWIGMIIIGIIMLSINTYALIRDVSFFKTAKTTKATITDIIPTDIRSGSQMPEVSYKIDNRNYTNSLYEYNSSMYVGKVVTIFYDPSNPNNIEGGFAGTFEILVLVLGIILISFGIYGLVKYKRRNNEQANLF